MARTAYVNGRYLPLDRATVGVEDRGYQFADAVYEVVKVVGGEPRDLDRHLDRLGRSLAALGIGWPMSREALRGVIARTLRRNRLRDASVYLQVGRGRAPRNFLFPKAARPSLVVVVRRASLPRPDEQADGVGVITLPDERWARRDIKTVGLLPNVLAEAEGGGGRLPRGVARRPRRAGDRGRLLERLHRRPRRPPRDAPARPRHPARVTRSVVLELARELDVRVVERRSRRGGRRAPARRSSPARTRWSCPSPASTAAGGDGKPGLVTERCSRPTPRGPACGFCVRLMRQVTNARF
jgi:D-alanine transaminase